MAEFSGRLGPHVVVREKSLTVMLISRTGSSRTFWVSQEALNLLVRQYGQSARLCFTVLHGRDVIELTPEQLPAARHSGAMLGFSLSSLRSATQQQLKLV